MDFENSAKALAAQMSDLGSIGHHHTQYQQRIARLSPESMALYLRDPLTHLSNVYSNDNILQSSRRKDSIIYDPNGIFVPVSDETNRLKQKIEQQMKMERFYRQQEERQKSQCPIPEKRYRLPPPPKKPTQAALGAPIPNEPYIPVEYKPTPIVQQQKEKTTTAAAPPQNKQKSADPPTRDESFLKEMAETENMIVQLTSDPPQPVLSPLPPSPKNEERSRNSSECSSYFTK